MNTTFKPWLVVGVILSLLRAQTPWTNWNVFADSTGNGVDPVTGFTPLCPDTFWLIVDTTGMGAAGITSYTWYLNDLGGNVVYNVDNNPPVPYPFPLSGVVGKRKVGVSFFGGGDNGSVILQVTYGSGTAAIAKPLTFKNPPSVKVLSPQNNQVICSSSPVNFSLSVTGADSFIVKYGPGPTDTVKNRLNFSLTPPSTSPWNIIVDAYYCGNFISTFHTLHTNASTAMAAILVGPTFSFCPGSNVSFSLAPMANITGYSSLTLTVKDPGNNTVFTANSLPATWTIPSGAASGTYNVQLSVNFPAGCGGPATAATSFNVYGSSTLTAPTISPNGGPYCVGTPINLWTSGQGLISWDIGDDGIWDYVGTPMITHTFPAGGPVPIKIRQDLGCFNRQDVINWSSSGSGSPSAFVSIVNPPPVICPGQPLTFKLTNIQNFLLSQSGSTLQWQAPWLNGGNPFNGYKLDTTLNVPNTPGNYTLSFTITNSCGTFTQSTNFTVGGTSSIFNPPLLLGMICTAGSAAKIVSPIGVGLQNIKYFVSGSSTPIGPVNPGDTISVTVPAAGLTVTAELNYGCTKIYEALNIRPTNAKATIQNVIISPSSACAGSMIQAFVAGQNGVQVRIYNGSTLITQVPVSMSNPPLFSSSFYFPAPSTSANLMIVVTGCGGNDTAYRPIGVSGTGATANFTAPMSGCVGQPVVFQRLGTNAGIQQASWSFGDFSPAYYDTSMTVTYTYSQPGIYNIQLTVQSNCGFSFMNKTIKIYATPPTLSGLSITSSGLQINYSVNAANADSVKWFFEHPDTTPAALGTSGTYTYGSTGTYTVAVTAYNGCGITTLTQVVNIISTGISTTSRSGEWLLYPNPTRNSLYLTHQSGYTGSAQVRLYDLNGRLVGQYVVESFPTRLDLQLPAGLYHAQIIHNKGIETLPFAVE